MSGSYLNCTKFFVGLMLAQFIAACSSDKHDYNEKSVTTKIVTSTENETNLIDSAEIRRITKEFQLDKIDTFPAGDINGDRKKDTIFIQPYDVVNMILDLTFSCDLPPIRSNAGFGGIPINIGDLNGDGFMEVLYYPEWFQSNAAMFYVYSYDDVEWKILAGGNIRRDILAESSDRVAFLKSRVKKINDHSFRITEHIWVDSDIVDSTKVIAIE